MHAWLCDEPVGVDALQWKSLAPLRPGSDGVLVEIKAASLNYPDLLMVQGKYQARPELPFVPGAEYAGVVKEVGGGVAHLRVGQRVACMANFGGFATHSITRASQCIPLSDRFPYPDAAAFVMIFATAHHALVARARIEPGETVLILGAAGGVGTAAIKVAKILGARVIAAASTEDKCDFCRSVGADETINYGIDASPQEFRNAVKNATGGAGPDVILDPIGGNLAEPAFRSIAWGGRYLVVGFAAGQIPSLPLNLPLLKGAAILGVFWGEFVRREPSANASMMAELMQWYEEGKVEPFIDCVVPMADLKKAMTRMGSRQVKGKIVLTN